MWIPGLLAVSLLPGPAAQETGQPARAASELARLPLRSELDLILVEARIGESEPLTFALDTGAPGIAVDSGVAERLGLPMGRPQKRPKSNRNELTYRYASSVSFRLADHEVTYSRVFVAPCEDMSKVMIGTPTHGILGHRFFARHVVEVDYERRELVLHDPRTYRYEGDGTALPLDFSAHASGLPYMSLTIESSAGQAGELKMLLDSGGSLMGTLGFGLRSTVDAFVPDDAPRVPMLGATGLADDPEEITHAVFVTRLHRVRIGPYAIDRPTVGCDATTHVGHDLFGAELLRRFHVVFDYERSRLILEPNAVYPEPPYADRSGMVLVASEDDLAVRRVMFVTPYGPASEAGLEAGDEILTIDDRPAGARSLHATRLLFCQLGEFRLVVRRGEKTWTTVLRTSDLL